MSHRRFTFSTNTESVLSSASPRLFWSVYRCVWRATCVRPMVFLITSDMFSVNALSFISVLTHLIMYF